MKQHLTPQDLDQLTDSGRQKLREWCASNGFFNPGPTTVGNEMKVVFALESEPLLDIGQMIQLIGDNTNDWGLHYQDTTCTWQMYYGYGEHIDGRRISYSDEELCDCLFKAVVSLLNKE